MSGSHKPEPDDANFHDRILAARLYAVNRYTLFPAALAFLLVGSAFGAENTWTGKITDSMCDKDHSMMATGGKEPDAKECTLACVKGGSKFVFVSNGKVYEIANQDMPELKTFAGG